MKFYEIDYCFFGISCLLTRNPGKVTAPRGRDPLGIPEGGGIRAFKARMLHTLEEIRNDPPIKRTALFRAGLLFL